MITNIFEQTGLKSLTMITCRGTAGNSSTFHVEKEIICITKLHA